MVLPDSQRVVQVIGRLRLVIRVAAVLAVLYYFVVMPWAAEHRAVAPPMATAIAELEVRTDAVLYNGRAVSLPALEAVLTTCAGLGDHRRGLLVKVGKDVSYEQFLGVQELVQGCGLEMMVTGLAGAPEAVRLPESPGPWTPR